MSSGFFNSGRQDFVGTLFHSSEWRDDVSLAGKRVAVIGTGASAVQVCHIVVLHKKHKINTFFSFSQIVPHIADRVGELTVYQRSPPFVPDKNIRPYSENMKV